MPGFEEDEAALGPLSALGCLTGVSGACGILGSPGGACDGDEGALGCDPGIGLSAFGCVTGVSGA